MPALFAYLLAVGILLGGGYGALSWLAAPEPVKVAAKNKPKPSPHYHASPQVTASASQASPPAPKDSDQAVTNSNDRPSSLQSEARAASEPGAQPQTPVAEDQQNLSAVAVAPSDETRQHAEASPEEKQEANQPPEAAPPVSANNQRSAASTTAPAPAAKTARRLHLRQASSRSEMGRERRALAVMTLRTIEFPDGRRVNVLVPYRGPERALAFQPDD